MIKAVIFDLDGTLVAFNLDVKACRTQVIYFLTEQGFPQSMFSVKETAFDMLVKVKKHLRKETKEQHKFAEIQKTVFSIVEKCELNAAKTTEMFPGIPQVLKSLKDMKLKTALCTISGEKTTRYLLDRFNLGNFFDRVITRENVSAVKPHPAHLEKALEMLNVQPQNAVLVGDSVKDIECAVKLNVLAVGVTTGLSSREELKCSGAHYIASSVTDIPVLVERLNRAGHGNENP